MAGQLQHPVGVRYPVAVTRLKGVVKAQRCALLSQDGSLRPYGDPQMGILARDAGAGLPDLRSQITNCPDPFRCYGDPGPA